MKTPDEIEFRSEDLGRRLADWMAATSPSHEPEGLAERAVSRTASVRQRPGFLVRLPLLERSFGLPELSRAQLVLLAGLVILALGVASGVGARLLNQQIASGASDSLIVLVPDGAAGQIRAIQPDGHVVGVVDGYTNGCGRHVLVADGSRVAYTFQGMPLQIAPLDGSPRVTVNSAQFLGGAFSPDRTRFAYLSGTSDGSDLTIVSLIDGTTTVIARGLEHASLYPWNGWSVQNTLAIGYVSDTEYGIDLIAADGTNRRSLVRRALAGRSMPMGVMVSWSPDGTRLAYEATYGLSSLGETWLVDAVTGRSTRVATADESPVDPWVGVANSAVFGWSPDGRSVTYRNSDGVGLLDLASGESRTLTDGKMPYWSPDGTRLAFLSQPGTQLTTMRADLSGRVDQRLEWVATGFAWSPDSRQIAVHTVGSLDLLDAAGIEPPTRISNDVRGWGDCMTWSEFEAP